MSNKIGDENVVNIEDDVELVKRYLKNSAYKESESNFFKNGGWEMVDLEIPKAMANILAELEQKDKRIKELEEENSKTQIMSPYYVKENYIPKQVIIDKIEELKNNLKYIDCNRDCSECFNKEGKALYRGSDFDFCFAYYQIKGLQELLEGEK